VNLTTFEQPIVIEPISQSPRLWDFSDCLHGQIRSAITTLDGPTVPPTLPVIEW
jgi:hypothetical protein